MKERTSSFDVFKVIAAFYVVYIYIPTAGTIGGMLVPVTRVAVPFFIMVSGYFLWNANMEIMREKIKKQIKYILFLTIFCNLMFFAWGIVKSILFTGSAIEYFKQVFSLDSLISFLVFNASPFSVHLWYLGCYLYVLVICYLFCNPKFFSKFFQIAFYLIPVLLLSDLVMGKYSLVLLGREFPDKWGMNFLFTGLPNFMLGCLLKKEEVRVKNLWRKDVFFWGYIFFTALSILEKYILLHFNLNAARDQYISTTPAVLCAFIFAMQNPNLLQGSVFEKIGREQSLTIYIIHPIFITLLSVVANLFHWGRFYDYIAPLAVFAVSLAFAMLWNSVLKPIVYDRYLKRWIFGEQISRA